MATRGLLLKTSILHEISKNKHSFERLIAAAIILKKTVGKNCSSGFLRSFYLANLKTKHYLGGYLRGIAGFTDQRATFTRPRGVLAKSKF